MENINKTSNNLIIIISIATLTLLFSCVGSKQIITINRSIEIEADSTKVLNYVSNLLKDPVWRAEVDSMVITKSAKYGDGAIEYSSFGKKNKTVTPTFKTKYTNNSVTFETPDTTKYYLASIRKVKGLKNGKTKFTYSLKFDNNITKEIAPFRIPKFITKMFYGGRMKKYIKVLKKELENNK